MKNTLCALAVGSLIIASVTGCGDSAPKQADKALGVEKEAAAAADHKAKKEHVHGDKCDHGHGLGPGKDKAAAIIGKLAFLPDVLAVVDGKEIKREDFVKMVTGNITPSQIVQFMSMPDDALKAQAAQFAKSEIEQIVMSKLAAEAGYLPSAEAVIKDFEKWLSTLTPEKMKQFEEKLERQKSNLADYKRKVSEDKKRQSRMAITKWLEEKVTSVSEAEGLTGKDISTRSKTEAVNKVLTDGKKRFKAEVKVK